MRMRNALALGPNGRLRLIADEEVKIASPPEALLNQLQAGLTESNAAGLLQLASPLWPAELPPTFAYWRNWVRLFFRSVCQAEEEPGESWRRLACPSDEDLAALVSAAPPTVGLEYLTVSQLQQSWQELGQLVADSALADAEGPQAWLQRFNPMAHLVGKVTFHLAENKRDPDRPFAFLATFAHKLSAQAKPQHRPLADALKQSVADRDRDQLERLLEPVRLAAEESTLVSELLKSKRLFAPQAWTAQEAYRFLQESPAMEAAGVVVRLPNWWSARRTPRPVVQVRIGKQPPSAVGIQSLIDFDADVVIEGEKLTPSELKELMSDSSGLRLLRGKWVEVDQKRIQEALDHWSRISEEHPDGLSMVQGMRLLAGTPISAAEDTGDSVAAWSTLVAGDWLKSTLERMRSPDPEHSCRPGRDLSAALRPYQAEGVHWLWFMTELGVGACLADDMGLGENDSDSRPALTAQTCRWKEAFDPCAPDCASISLGKLEAGGNPIRSDASRLPGPPRRNYRRRIKAAYQRSEYRFC